MAFRPSSLLVTMCAILFVSLTVAEVRGDDLKMRDGLVIKADQIWERDGEIWFRQGHLIRSVPKSAVASPLKSAATTSVARRKPNASPLRPDGSDQSGAPSNSDAARITFKDGAILDADAVSESSETIRYRLGNMQGFVERGLVISVVRATPAPPVVPLPDRPREFSTGHVGLDQLIAAEAGKNDVDPLLVFLVMRQESGFNRRAVSRAGARGLMQLMPATARMLGVRNIHDPKENVGAGTRYLRMLLDRYSGDVNLTLAAYNAGEDAVARSGNKVPRYRETVGYVRKIGWAYYKARQ